MSNQKKFGAFAGVFTPSLLTILGVIMYMRLGWVVGNAGLIGTIIIIVIAHVISITTGLSISSIATDKKVGAGGVYYVLSRSLGLPIGGAIGVTLFVGTALSIALYLIGFAESFNPYFGFASDINGLRLGGSLALLTLTTIAFISTSLALRAQFFILAAIILSIISILVGTSPGAPTSLPMFAPEGGVSMETIFAIFFPAVTGFTAGIAMSGDLSDPKKSIPAGTLWSIAVGFVVYIGLATFIFFKVDGEILRTDNDVLRKLAWFGPAVVAGIWGATLSSALGGILGGPRILQAMSVDKITPRRFAKGVGKDNEPRNALILTVLIAEGGVLIGELDTIARVCSMFYLAAYGFINISFFLESWASTDFNPTFKVKKWIGLVGFIATFVVMFRLDMVAMIIAFIVIGGIYFWLAKKELALGSGDIWQSVWSSVVKTGLRRMDEEQDHKRNWKPNVLLFSAGTTHRPHLLEFSKELVGNRGFVTNFDLYENQDAKVLFPKREQSVNDEILKQYGVFGRQIEVKNEFKGIESIASTFGFSGIEPNTILMGWAKNTKDPIWFAQMTQKLIDLDYNVLYLDYDERFGWRKYAQIDLWWRGVGNNSELMLNIAKFLLSSDLWRNAQVRILLVDDTNSNKKVIEKKVEKILEEARIAASIKIIGNALEKKPLYELMKVYSSEADLIFVGIPEVDENEVENFVATTNDLVRTIGTTLLVKASSQFDDINFTSTDGIVEPIYENGENNLTELPTFINTNSKELNNQVIQFEFEYQKATNQFVENAIGIIQEKYTGFYQMLLNELKRLENPRATDKDIYEQFALVFQHLHTKLEKLRTEELPVLDEIFREENFAFLESVNVLLKKVPNKLKFQNKGVNTNIKFKKAAQLLSDKILIPSLQNTYLNFGKNCFDNLMTTSNEVIAKTYSLFELEGFYQNNQELKEEIIALTADLKQLMKKHLSFFQNLTDNLELEILTAGRNFCNELTTISQNPNFGNELKLLQQNQNKKEAKIAFEEIQFFPSSWKKNQEVIHTSMETNLKLAEANLLINKGVGSLTQTLNEKVNLRIENQFSEYTTTLEKLIQEYKSGKEIKSLEDFKIDESPFVGIEMLMQKLKKQTAPISTMIKEDAVLMSKSLMEDFEKLQLEGMPPISLDLPKIVDFIMESILNGPVQNHLERYLSDVSSIYFKQINRVNLLKYTLSESKEDKEIDALLERMQTKFAIEKELFETTKIRIIENLRAIEYDLQMELDTHYLVEHADNWSRYISVSKRKKGIAKINEQVRGKISGWYNGLNTTVSTKQHESVVSVFEAKYDLKSNVELGLNFVHEMYPAKAVVEKLPFYYKQLFQGKHLPVQHEYIGRNRELEQLDNVILEGRKGAILIAGKSSSGKTHFSEYIAETKFKGTVYQISSIGRQGSVQQLNRVIASTTGKMGNVEQCFSGLKKNSIILINDIEVWWNRTLEKDALTVLIEMVERFHNKHIFILNVNIHAMEALSKQRDLKKVVTSTIILSPVSRDAMKEVILERHKVGGLDMELRGEENRLEGKYFNHLMNKIYTESDGNIGLGLQIWLRQITSFSDNKILLEEQPNLEMLKVGDAYWKWILYQFLINKNLTKAKLKTLFGEDADEISNHLSELLKSEVLDDVGKNTYTLNNVVKPNVEKWLTNINILN